MSAPAVVACAFAAVLLGVPVVAAGTQLEARHRAAGAADAVALAAADAAEGWVSGVPCELAGEVAREMRVELVRCRVAGGDARVEVRTTAAFGGVQARARAATVAHIEGQVNSAGWAWPSGVRTVTQGFHEGFAIDLAVAADGALYAPYQGIVVASGEMTGGIPSVCVENPSWWRGPNHAVIIRHEVAGRALYSSHNHIAPGSGASVGTEVRAGQRVATAGMSGCTAGLHTHFTLSTKPSIIHPDVNPYDYL